ncbi:hypothetical protein SAMN02910447_01598 [Ruminococcus sp. YE71]|uniref:hypothetical protein n=1 Tax=unclassified Ruminococcus TaxID=2608920 RepID=UPI0008817452|nr:MULTISPECIES: hypothetical protein [unclassified Ruminococcus]SDA19573.1 hypothetical protein SAMN02910446_01599 [Ruminococcus sp. YE78]SFW31019.1 hypothetical protein SAMN02910447_01598 [Ruminococcus sp. YE71]
MDDIMTMLQGALSDPETAQKINGLLSSLGSSEPETPPPEPKLPDGKALPDMQKLMQVSQVLSSSGSNDPYIVLLTSLRPLLKSETQLKLDRVVKIFRLMSAYPAIKESGLLEML